MSSEDEVSTRGERGGVHLFGENTGKVSIGGSVNVTLNFLTSTNAEGQAALARIVSGGTLPTHTPVRRRPEPAAAIVVASPSVDQSRALPVENTDQRVCVCVCVCCMWSMCSCNVCVWHGQCSLPFPSQGYGLHSACW